MTKAAKERDKLRAFAQELMESWPEGGIDGGELQELAVKHGLLAPTMVTESCGEEGEGCACSEFGFPTECYRKTDLLKGTP